MNHKPGAMSVGEQQRVAVARALANKPVLLLADEPTGNLDKDTANEVMKLFFEYCENENAGMVLVTHDEKLAHMCDKVYKLENKVLKAI